MGVSLAAGPWARRKHSKYETPRPQAVMGVATILTRPGRVLHPGRPFSTLPRLSSCLWCGYGKRDFSMVPILVFYFCACYHFKCCGNRSSTQVKIRNSATVLKTNTKKTNKKKHGGIKFYWILSG